MRDATLFLLIEAPILKQLTPVRNSIHRIYIFNRTRIDMYIYNITNWSVTEKHANLISLIFVFLSRSTFRLE